MGEFGDDVVGKKMLEVSNTIETKFLQGEKLSTEEMLLMIWINNAVIVWRLLEMDKKLASVVDSGLRKRWGL